MFTKFHLLDTIKIPPQIEQFNKGEAFKKKWHNYAYVSSSLSEIIGSSRFLILSGPSGVGKSVVLSNLRADANSNINWRTIKRITTRTRRPKELDEELIFVPPSEFDTLYCANKFLYVESYPGTGAMYGVLKDDLIKTKHYINTKNVFVIIGTLELAHLLPQAFFVYLVPPSVAELRRRVESSKPNAPDIIDYDKRELACLLSLVNDWSFSSNNASIICNDDGAICARKISNMLTTGETTIEIPDQLQHDILQYRKSCHS